MEYNSLFIVKKRTLITNKNYKKTLFLNLFSDWLEAAQQKILIAEGFISEKAITLSFNSLYDTIIEISERALVVEYRVFEEELNKESGEEKLLEFEKELLSVEYRKYVLEEYPELFRLVFENINYFVENLNDIISNYINDFDEIKAMFNVQNSDIEYIRIGLGDNHNKNKSTSLLKINNESPIIFKPRDLALEVCFSNFLTYYNNSCGTNIYLPKTLYRKKYSWTEFIKSSNQDTQKAYLFEEIGHTICLLYFLNGTDFHYENIIVNDTEGLVLIDCESLLYPIVNTRRNEHNVLSIGLLPKKIKVGNQQVDFSGLNLNADITQDSPIEREAISIENGEITAIEGKNILVKPNNFQLDGQENANDYIDEILAGFKKSYLFLMENKDELIAFFDTDSADYPIRFLLRNTYLYSHVLYESLSPILLTDQEDRISFMQQLEEPYFGFNNLLDSEVADLYNNDIPYYYCNVKSTTLENTSGLSQDQFFEKSPLDALHYKLYNKISKRDLEQQLLLIRYSFAQNTSQNSTKIFSKRYVSENINLIYDHFKNLVGESSTYFTLQESYKEANQYNLEYTHRDLINGMFGDILFLAEANKIFKNSYISETISRLYKDNVQQLCSSEYIGMAGMGGAIYFLSRMYRIYNDDQYINEALRCIESSDLMNNIEKSQNNGVIYGRAGLLIALIELKKIKNDSAVNQLIHFTYNQMISSAVVTPEGIHWLSEFHHQPLCGVAHGSSGIILSLLRYFKLFEDAECKNIIQQAVLFENTLYSTKHNNWADNRSFVSEELKYSTFGWSHGAPGIGLVRLELIESNIFQSEDFLNILKTDLQNCVESTYKNGFKGNDSLIFGKFGNSELLVRFSDHIKDTKLLSEIESHLNSFNSLSFIKNNRGLIIPGLFNGVSGYGYQLLFFNKEIKNSILTFECN
ncbi:type 2 lanthipeptide synthetase LanM [Chryseobacterium sp. c4a]|uniref:type 2 lanthipeptide synthetase LanM n=1 Tax=Chryseobacterium sp. c4a TaxID=1573582 RepID=UPI0013599C08|nr:type 2 lanthipeptide synthetase LanM [Chryseobacterium sp. c4a]